MHDPTLPPDPFNPLDPRNDPYHPDNPNRGGLPVPSGPGIVILAILYLIMLLSAVSAVAALAGAPVVIFLAKWQNWDDPPPWSAAFSAVFQGFFVYFLLSLMQTMWLGRESMNSPGNIWSFAAFQHLLLVQSLPMLACAAVIRWKLADYFVGFSGYLRTVLAGFLSLLFANGMTYALAHRVDTNETDQGLFEAMMGLALLTFLLGVFGGIPATIPIGIGTKFAARNLPRAPHLGRIYLAAVLAIVTWVGATGVFEFLLDTVDPIYFWIKAYQAAEDQPLYLAAHRADLIPLIIAFFLLQIAPVGLAGSVLANRLRPVFPGRAGWISASILAFLGILAALAPLAVLILAMIASGAGKELLQYF